MLTTTIRMGNLALRPAWLEPFAARHPTFALWAFIYLALALLSVGLTLIDERTLAGASVWSKPLKFKLSLAVFLLTLAWFAPLLPAGFFDRWHGRAATWAVVLMAALEMTYIIIQAARGEPSHFNTTTTLAAAAYSLMAFGAVTLVVVCGWLGALILFHPRSAALTPYTLAVGLGLVLTLLLGGGFGLYLGGQSSHWVGSGASNADGIALVGWASDGGDLRVAHFFGMHAMQVLPLVGWLAMRAPGGRAGYWLVLLFGSTYAAITVRTFTEAVAGQPFFLASFL